MQQVYLLLRNNQQKGPYTLEQLLGQQLKPFDLVWVEGRSAAWQYPGEVNALKPYVPAPPQTDQPYKPLPTAILDGEEPQQQYVPTPQPQQQYAPPIQPAAQPQQSSAPKNIFVSMPRGASQVAASTSAYTQPAPEPVRPAAPSYQQPTPPPQPVMPVTSFEQPYSSSQQTVASSFANTQQPAAAASSGTKYARSMDEVEEAYTHWMYNQKTKKKNRIEKKDLSVAALLLLFIGGGYWLLSKPSVTASRPPLAQAAIAATPVPAQTETASGQEQISAQEPASSKPAATNTAPATTSSAPLTVAISENKAAAKQKLVKPAPAASQPAVEKTVVADVPVEEPRVKETPPVQEEVSAASAPATGNASPKKKKLRDVFKNMFSKKDKPAETAAAPVPAPSSSKKVNAPVQEDPRPANNRQAARRGDSGNDNTTTAAPAAETATPISELVDVSSNAPDSWMMGVTGLKITMRNRSAAQLQTAAVEVLYYDQNDKLLDKKTLYFNGVQPKGRQTQAAPDNKWADHIELKLGSVTAKDERYAGAK